MLGWLGRLFGSPKALDAVVDSTRSALDKLVYTDEERAEDAARAVTEARSMTVEWMAQTKGQNQARRFIAVSIVVAWLLTAGATLITRICYIWFASPELAEVTTALDEFAGDMMHTGVIVILGFYFAAPHMSKVVDAWVTTRAQKIEAHDRRIRESTD